MKILFKNPEPECNFQGQKQETTDVNQAPTLRINGIAEFQFDYAKDDEIRTAIRIHE